MGAGKRLFLVDGYNIIFRSYFSFIQRPLRNSEGENTSAIFGFFRTMGMIIRKYQPEYLLIAFDSLVPTFRHERYAEYKQTRDKTPEDLRSQIPLIEEMLGAVGVPVVRVDGYEADDVIAAYAGQCREHGWECRIVSSDKDLMQLVDESTLLLKPTSGISELQELDTEGVVRSKGIRPGQVGDYLALVGDSSDNIPGVAGIGEKSAVTLLGAYGDLGGVYAHVDELKPGQRGKLLAGRESAELSRELVALRGDTPVAPQLTELPGLAIRVGEDARELFVRQNMHAMVKELSGLTGGAGGADGADGEGAGGVGGGVDITGRGSAATREKNYQLVTTLAGLDECLKVAGAEKLCAFDVETDSLNPMVANMVGFSVAIGGGRAWYVPLRGPEGEVLPEGEVRERVGRFLGNPDMGVIGQNIKYDLKVLRRWGVEVARVCHDTMIAAWLLDTTANAFSMDKLAEIYLNYQTIPFPDAAKKSGFVSIALDEACEYAAEDADITYALYEELIPRLQRDPQLWKLYQEVEMPLLGVLAGMEYTGIHLNGEQLVKYGERMRGQLELITADIYSLAGEEFNINSTKQLQGILFDKIGLTPIKKIKTGYSTDTSVLQLLRAAHPLPEKLLHYRMVSKLLSTYVEALPKLIHPVDKRIHTNYNLTGTATGRMSSNDPNLQNIPIRDREGREIRKAFIPQPGWRFVSADYSQIELVIFAHLAQDKALLQAFAERADIHCHTGGLIFGVAPGEVDDQQRRIAKTINFGVIYGMSAFRLARELGISQKEAVMFIDRYFETYKGVREYIDKIVEQAGAEGGVRTLLGRWRAIPEINSRNKMVRQGAERVAVNTPIQGSAADIIKLSMLRVARRLESEKLESRLLLQVHDELLVEAPVDEVERIEGLLREEMTGCYELTVPLKVDVSTGDSWGALK